MKPSPQPLPPAIFIMGPTASGKTGAALALAQHFPVEIISVDSALVYRGLDIGTAKPSTQEQQSVPHHFIDILDPAAAYSAAQFCTDAMQMMLDITQREHIPLLVGGTMLYFKALQQGLAPMPQADQVIREQINAKIKQKGTAILHRFLRRIDPLSAQRIHPNDPQRIQRALEIYFASGQSRSQLHAQAKTRDLPFHVLKLVLSPINRSVLHARIAARFSNMLQKGFIDEVAQLKKRADLSLEKPSMRTVGYRQIWLYLEGKFDFETMQEKGIAATRQLAKRQLTWLRAEPQAEWINSECLEIDDLLKKINVHLRKK